MTNTMRYVAITSDGDSASRMNNPDVEYAQDGSDKYQVR